MGLRPYVVKESIEYECVEGYNYRPEDLYNELEKLSESYKDEFPFTVFYDEDNNYTITIFNYKNFIHAVEKEYNLPNEDDRNMTPYNGIRFAERLGLSKTITTEDVNKGLFETHYNSTDGVLQVYCIARDLNCIEDDFISIRSF